MRLILVLSLASLAVGCQDYNFAEQLDEEVFFQADDAVRTDVLFVIDDSASMSEEQDLLAANFQAFVDVLLETRVDFQLGVVTTDTTVGTAGMLRGGILSNTTEELPSRVRQALDVGTHGAREERGLEAASMALVSERNPGFVRTDSRLSLVFFSDEDDESEDEVDHYLALFEAASGGEPWAAHAVVGDLPYGCAAGINAADAGSRYIEAARQTEGQIESICVEDYTEALTRIGLDSAGLRTTFPLQVVPDPGTLEVRVDEVLIPHRVVDGWTWSAGDNAIVFHGRAIPRPGMTIVVRYAPWNGEGVPSSPEPDPVDDPTTDPPTDTGL